MPRATSRVLLVVVAQAQLACGYRVVSGPPLGIPRQGMPHVTEAGPWDIADAMRGALRDGLLRSGVALFDGTEPRLEAEVNDVSDLPSPSVGGGRIMEVRVSLGVALRGRRGTLFRTNLTLAEPYAVAVGGPGAPLATEAHRQRAVRRLVARASDMLMDRLAVAPEGGA